MNEYYRFRDKHKILNRDYDMPAVALSIDVAHGVNSVKYTDFLYGNCEPGFLSQFMQIRKGTLNRAFKLHQKYSGTGNVPNNNEIRRISKEEYWQHKEFLSRNMNNSKVIGLKKLQNNKYTEHPISYEDGEQGLEVHHLIPLKTMLKPLGTNEELTYKSILKLTDSKYQVAMTAKAHRFGENYGHSGNTHNSPKISNPYEVPTSVPKDYYKVLEDKREELHYTDLGHYGLATGVVSFLAAKLANKHDTKLNFYNINVTKVLEKASIIGFSAATRDLIRDEILNSKFLHSNLFDFRDSLITKSVQQNGEISDLIGHFGDVDALADAVSLGGAGLFYEGYSVFKNYKDSGYIDKHAIRNGFIKAGTISSGKYILTAFIDPTGASFVVISIYAGGKIMFSYHERSKIKELNTNLIIYRRKAIERRLDEKWN